jgi:hypothetical protein
MKKVFGKTEHAERQLIGRKAKIHPNNDNENYDRFRDAELIITNADNEGRGYDMAAYPQMLCCFKCTDGREFPFSLYEYEFVLL